MTKIFECRQNVLSGRFVCAVVRLEFRLIGGDTPGQRRAAPCLRRAPREWVQ